MLDSLECTAAESLSLRVQGLMSVVQLCQHTAHILLPSMMFRPKVVWVHQGPLQSCARCDLWPDPRAPHSSNGQPGDAAAGALTLLSPAKTSGATHLLCKGTAISSLPKKSFWKPPETPGCTTHATDGAERPAADQKAVNAI